MASNFRLTWRAEVIQRRVREASRKGIDITMALCVVLAKKHPPLPFVSGTAQGSIQMRPAEIQRDRVVGRWGSFDVDYFIWLEIGARGRPGGFYLRGAADREYPQLVDRIRKQLGA